MVTRGTRILVLLATQLGVKRRSLQWVIDSYNFKHYHYFFNDMNNLHSIFQNHCENSYQLKHTQ